MIVIQFIFFSSHLYDYKLWYNKDEYDLIKKELNELKSALFIP